MCSGKADAHTRYSVKVPKTNCCTCCFTFHVTFYHLLVSVLPVLQVCKHLSVSVRDLKYWEFKLCKTEKSVCAVRVSWYC